MIQIKKITKTVLAFLLLIAVALTLTFACGTNFMKLSADFSYEDASNYGTLPDENTDTSGNWTITNTGAAADFHFGTSLELKADGTYYIKQTQESSENVSITITSTPTNVTLILENINNTGKINSAMSSGTLTIILRGANTFSSLQNYVISSPNTTLNIVGDPDYNGDNTLSLASTASSSEVNVISANTLYISHVDTLNISSITGIETTTGIKSASDVLIESCGNVNIAVGANGGEAFDIYVNGTVYLSKNSDVDDYNIGGGATKNYTGIELSFDSNGGSTPPAPIAYVTDGGVSLPDGTGITKAGFSFGGWWTGSGGTGTQITQVTSSNFSLIGSTVYAKWISQDARLQTLSIGGVNLTPNFNLDILNYTATVPNGTDEVAITATKNHANADFSLESSYALEVGTNEITITVTAEDTTYTKTYTIVVTRSNTVNPIGPPPYNPPYNPPSTDSYAVYPPIPPASPAPENPYVTPSMNVRETDEGIDFTTANGVTSTVITPVYEGVKVEAGVNESGSINSQATAAAVSEAAQIARKNGETSVTIQIPEGATGLSKSTVQKLVEAASGMNITLELTAIVDGEVVGGVTLPLTAKTGQILTGLYFDTKRTEQIENYVTNKWDTDVLGSFETAQKGGWGTTATLSISLEKLGFSADDGTKLYALIYDTKARKWYQSNAEVIDGEVVIKTKRTGIVTIVTDSVK
jgi:hypothetical protein